MEKEILEVPGVLKKSLANNKPVFEQIRKVIDEKDIKFVMIAARGTSDHAGVYAKYAIESTLGIPVVLAAPSISTIYETQYKLDDAMVIGISQSGQATDVIRVLEDAKAKSAITISITNDENSKLANITDYHLFCNAGKEVSVAATKTFYAQLGILAELTSVMNGYDDFDENMNNIISNIENILLRKNEIFKIATSLKEMKECFTLSRGYNYSIACESALKMQECAYVKAKVFSTADFQHGPIAMVDEGCHCFLYANEEKFLTEYKEIVAKLRDYGAYIIIVSDDSNLLKQADIAIEIPTQETQYLVPFYTTAIIQLLACGLSLAKGLNPDVPRNLKKITLTK